MTTQYEWKILIKTKNKQTDLASTNLHLGDGYYGHFGKVTQNRKGYLILINFMNVLLSYTSEIKHFRSMLRWKEQGHSKHWSYNRQIHIIGQQCE
jgi:hypothetical protein